MRSLYLYLGRGVLLAASILACEGVARLLLPPQQVVEITQKPASGAMTLPREVVEEGHIDSVINFGGKYGSRLVPNISASIKNHSLSHQDVLIETNSLGLRGPEMDPEGQRILVMGDSITLSDYVNDGDTIPRILEKRLRDEGRWVSVLNAGLPGASTRDEYYHYLELRDPVDPDVVLVLMYLNDVADSENFYARTLRWPYSKSRLLSWAFGRYQLFRDVSPGAINPAWMETFRRGRDLHSGDMLHDKDAFDYEVYHASNDFGLAWAPQSWEILTKMFSVFRDAAVQGQSKFSIALLPVHLQVLGTVGDTYPQEQFTKMCRGLSIDCLDLLPVLRLAAMNKDRKLYYDHCHMTAAGNSVVAEGIKEWLDTLS